jgi:hypothetical protein
MSNEFERETLFRSLLAAIAVLILLLALAIGSLAGFFLFTP